MSTVLQLQTLMPEIGTGEMMNFISTVSSVCPTMTPNENEPFVME